MGWSKLKLGKGIGLNKQNICKVLNGTKPGARRSEGSHLAMACQTHREYSMDTTRSLVKGNFGDN